MVEETWVSPFLESLREMSDAFAQRRAWLDGDPSNFPTPVELVCQVFDDSGLDDALADGPVFSSEADDLLRQLSSVVEAEDGYWSARELGRRRSVDEGYRFGETCVGSDLEGA